MLHLDSAEIVEIHESELGDVRPQPSAKDHLGLHDLGELGLGKDLVSQEVLAKFFHTALRWMDPIHPCFGSDADAH